MSWMMLFFKQKTAYEMRISDWSSDVCSADLRAEDMRIILGEAAGAHQALQRARGFVAMANTHLAIAQRQFMHRTQALVEHLDMAGRSDARRVGNECVR